jgi:hypothetical protein
LLWSTSVELVETAAAAVMALVDVGVGVAIVLDLVREVLIAVLVIEFTAVVVSSRFPRSTSVCGRSDRGCDAAAVVGMWTTIVSDWVGEVLIAVALIGFKAAVVLVSVAVVDVCVAG